MKKPRIYNSELLLQNLLNKSDTNQIIRYIRSLNSWIDYLEKHVDLEDLDFDDSNNKLMEDEE